MQPSDPIKTDVSHILPKGSTALVAAWRSLGKIPKTNPENDWQQWFLSNLADLATPQERLGQQATDEAISAIERVLQDFLEDGRSGASSFWRIVRSFSLSAKTQTQDRADFDVDIVPSNLVVLPANLNRLLGSHVVDGQHRTYVLQSFISAKKREAIIDSLAARLLSKRFGPSSDTKSVQDHLADLAAYAGAVVDARTQLRFIFRFPPPPAGVQNTRVMVLSYALWTGCPPPNGDVVVAQTARPASQRVGVYSHDFTYFGPSHSTGPAARLHRDG